MTRSAPMTPTMYRIRERHEELPDTFSLTLDPGLEAIAPVRPGQFTMLWAFGVGEAPISVARIGDNGSLIQTIRSVGSVTSALSELRPGDEIGVRGPFGTSWPVESARGQDVLIMAGGLGLAPVRPVIDQIIADRDTFGRCRLLVGARSPAGLLYADELNALAAAGQFEVEVTVDVADETWTGNVGLITKLIARSDLDVERTHAFICGPEPMMRFSAMGLTDRGVPADQIWVSLERNMHCGVVACGHCQLGPLFLCRDGAVVAWPSVKDLLGIAER